jgi:phosphopantetheinyl transferase (holo-ACP synthase)
VKSAGNDIVALNAIDIQRTRDIRFYSKFITDSELAIFQQQTGSLPFEVFVWLLWSVKESAYKYLQRHNAGLIFSPIKFIVEQLNTPPDFNLTPFKSIDWDSKETPADYLTGSVSYGNTTLYFRSYLTDDFITSVVDADEQFENVYWGIKLIEQTDHQHQSQEVRNFALNKLKALLAIDDLHIVKSEIGYPVVMEGVTPLEVVLSFAHHDRWVGYSFKWVNIT